MAAPAVYTVITNETSDNQTRTIDLKWKYFFRQLWIASCCWTIYFSMGLYLGSPTVMIPQVRSDVNSTIIITDDMASWLTSIFSYAAIPWVILLPYLARRIGRKKTSFISSVSTFIAYILFYFSKTITQLLIAESIIAITHASVATITVIVISEYTSPKYRGMFLTIKSASLFWGIWASNSIGTFFHWRYIPVFGFICSIYTLSVGFWPESPYWLAFNNKFDECKTAHFWLKGNSEDSKFEFEKLVKSQTLRKEVLSLKFFSKREFYMPMFLSMVAICQYHLSGKFVFSMYAVEMIKKIINDQNNVYKCMLILDGVTVFSSYIGCFLTRILKRRTLLITSSSIAIMFLFVMSLYLYLIKLSYINENQYLSIIFLSGFSLAISTGPMILATSLYGELTPLKYKTISIILIGFLFLLLHGTLLKLAPILFSNLGMHGTFLFYGLLSSLCVLLIYLYLPETKDKSLSEIEEFFKNKTLEDTMLKPEIN